MIQIYFALQGIAGSLQARLHRDEGATAVEYGLMVGLIAVVIIAAVIFLGEELNSMFEAVGAALSPATP